MIFYIKCMIISRFFAYKILTNELKKQFSVGLVSAVIFQVLNLYSRTNSFLVAFFVNVFQFSLILLLIQNLFIYVDIALLLHSLYLCWYYSIENTIITLFKKHLTHFTRPFLQSQRLLKSIELSNAV